MADKVYICQQSESKPTSIADFIKQQNKESDGKPKKIQFISPMYEGLESTDTSVFPSLGEYVIGLCRAHSLLPNSRVTVLSQQESVQALQLCLAQKNKEKGDAFDVEESKVFEYQQKIMAAKLHPDDISSSQTSVELLHQYNYFLTSCLHVDMADIVATFLKELQKPAEESELQRELGDTMLVLLASPSGQVEKQLIGGLCGDKQVTELINTDLSGDSPSFSQHLRSISEIQPLVNQTPSKMSSQDHHAIQQLFTSQVLLSYLHILVNSRSELALAKIFNVPHRELDRHAFTALKHMAQNKNMSMFQTATSFLMRIRLGGKSYRPDMSCPLNVHTKGVGELVDLIHNLQTVAEEQPDIRVACRRVLNIVKNRLIKCPILKLGREDVEEATTRLYNSALCIIESLEASNKASPDKPAAEGGSQVGRKTLRIFRLLLDKMAASQGGDNSQYFLNDLSLNPTTPTRVPSLLSQFRSPEVVEAEEDSPEKQESKGLVDRTNVQAYANSEVILPCGEKITRKQLNSVIVFPSKTVAHPAPETAKMMLGLKPDKKRTTCAALDKENIRAKPDLDSDQPAKKRRITQKAVKEIVQKDCNESEQIENHVEPSSSQPSQSKKKAPVKKGCRRRLMPQVKGQQKLTGFFRV